MSSQPDTDRINAIILVILLPAQHLPEPWLTLELPNESLAFHSLVLDHQVVQRALLSTIMMAPTALHTNPRSGFLFDPRHTPTHTLECKRKYVCFQSEVFSTSPWTRVTHSFPLLTSPVVTKSFYFFLNPNLHSAGRTTWYRTIFLLMPFRRLF